MSSVPAATAAAPFPDLRTPAKPAEREQGGQPDQGDAGTDLAGEGGLHGDPRPDRLTSP